MHKPRVMIRMRQIRKHNAFLIKLIKTTQNQDLISLYEAALIKTDLTGRTVLKSLS